MNTNEKNDLIVSLPLLFVPFLNRDDGTRLQMALSQMRQGLPLHNGEKPLVETGYEPYFNRYANITIKSYVSGTIIYIHKKFILIAVDKPLIDNEIEIINLPYLSNIIVNVGDHIEKGQILGYIKNSSQKPKSILDGVNLLTLIKMHVGYNYEDAVVISKSASQKLLYYEFITKTITFSENQILLSLEEDRYKPLLEREDIITPDKPIAIIKNGNLKGKEIFKNEKKIFLDTKGIVVDVKYFINKQNVVYREFQKFINSKIDSNVSYLDKMIKNIIDNYNKYSNKKIKKLPDYVTNAIQYYSGALKRRAYKYKNAVIDASVEYTIMTLAPSLKGDKFANRHGNKGVNSNDFSIVDDKFMPKTKDGKTIDMIINIMGIPSRMNIGQIFELASSNIIYKLKNDLKDMISKKEDINIIKDKIKEFYFDIDFTKDKWIKKTYYTIVDEINNYEDLELFINEMSFLAPSMEAIDIDNLIKLKKKYNVDEKQVIYNPITDKEEIGIVGYMYWMKLYHLAREKLAARSIGEYLQKTNQPTSGKKNKGGQRVGEMEIWNLISHGLTDALKEMIYIKSDDLKGKTEVLDEIIETGNAHLPLNSLQSKISNIAENYFKAVGINIIDEDENGGN